MIYPTIGVILCFLAGRFLADARILPFWISLIVILLQLAAGLFDVIENLIMLRVIDGPTSDFWLTIARISTACKFGFIRLGLLHVIFGLLAWLYRTWLSSSAA